MKIVRLKSENVKRLRCVEIEPSGDVVRVCGPNAAGKTSVLDSVAMAIGGGALIPSKPIRDGAESATIEVDLGDLRVRRRFTKSGSYLEVTNAEGAAYKSPQSILDKLVGKLSFDPLEFTRMSDREQRAVMLRITGLESKLIEIDGKRTEAYNARRDVGRTLDQTKAQAVALGPIEPAPEAPVSVSDLMRKLKEAREQIEQNNAVRYGVDYALRRLEAANRNVEESHKIIRQREEALEAARSVARAAVSKVDAAHKAVADARAASEALRDPDVASIEAEIFNSESINAAVARNSQRVTVWQKVAAITDTVQELTKLLANYDATKSEALSSASWPIDGLGFDETGITFHDVPFRQASQAEQLRTSISIAAALNPKLRVILIRDGSLLDSNSMALLAAEAERLSLQVWIEQVADCCDDVDAASNPSVVFIDDGELLRFDSEEQKAAAAS